MAESLDTDYLGIILDMDYLAFHERPVCFDGYGLPNPVSVLCGVF